MRRGTAFLVHLLLLQFLWLGGGDACVSAAMAGGGRSTVVQAVPRDNAGAAMAGMTMGGMTMAGMGGGTRDGLPAAAATDPACGTHGGRGNRPGPHAPAACATLAPCAPAALPSSTPRVVASVPTRGVADVPSYAVFRPASRATAPEPPPPRA